MDNREVIKRNWKGLASKVRPHWIGLSETDVATIDGNYDVLLELLREKYGYSHMQAQLEVEHFLEVAVTVPESSA